MLSRRPPARTAVTGPSDQVRGVVRPREVKDQVRPHDLSPHRSSRPKPLHDNRALRCSSHSAGSDRAIMNDETIKVGDILRVSCAFTPTRVPGLPGGHCRPSPCSGHRGLRHTAAQHAPARAEPSPVQPSTPSRQLEVRRRLPPVRHAGGSDGHSDRPLRWHGRRMRTHGSARSVLAMPHEADIGRPKLRPASRR